MIPAPGTTVAARNRPTIGRLLAPASPLAVSGDTRPDSPAASEIDLSTSPVFTVQGSGDRTRDHARMAGPVEMLRPRNVCHQLTVIPDDVHEPLIPCRLQSATSSSFSRNNRRVTIVHH